MKRKTVFGFIILCIWFSGCNENRQKSAKISGDISSKDSTAVLVTDEIKAFENEYMGFRIYADGWPLDFFGKTKAGHGLRLKNFFKLEEPIIEDYHTLSKWGIEAS